MSDTTLLNAAADAAGLDLESAWFAIHDGTGSGDEVSNSRAQPSYDPATGGTASLASTIPFTGPASGAATHLGVWDASTTGSLRFTVALSGDTAFNANGDLTLVEADITVT